MKNILLVAFILITSGCANDDSSVDRESDLETLHDGMLLVDQSFSDESRKAALEKYELLKSTAEDMSGAEFILAMAEIAAMSNNGHSALFYPWAETFNRLAVRFYIADDGLFIADAMPEYEHLVGLRVEKLENQTLDELRNIWDRYDTGRVGHRDKRMYGFIESPDVLYAAKIATSTDSASLVLGNGQTVIVGTSEEWPARKGYLQVLDFNLAATGRIKGDPLYLQEPKEVVRLIDLPEYDAVYLQFRRNEYHIRFPWSNFYKMTQKIQDEITKKEPGHIIVDQRFNGGGDLNNTRDLMEAIPNIIGKEGKVVVITSGRTYSAAISSVGYLKQAGGSRVIIVGAPIGDELEFWAEGPGIKLPHSGALLDISTERHNYKNGCSEDDCHESIRIHPIAVPTLDPDLQPVRNFDMVMNGEDPYLDAAIELIK